MPIMLGTQDRLQLASQAVLRELNHLKTGGRFSDYKFGFLTLDEEKHFSFFQVFL